LNSSSVHGREETDFARNDRNYAIKRYDDETRRIYGVVEKQLEGKTYLVGEKYTIADLKMWGW
jgi:GSH-dependent disulfide-bond oxidoreductase